jgi:DNA adenine methylase
VLLRRPHKANRSYHSETVNDADGLLVNFWRAVQAEPEAVAEHASWPVAEADLHARHLAILKWRTDEMLLRLMGDAAFYDARIAGWWVWGLCCWIGSGWCSGDGAWIADDDGRLVKQSKTGKGVHRKKPWLSADGRGAIKPQLREPGITRQKAYLGDNGRGVVHGNVREPGIGEPHPMAMPKLIKWMKMLCARLRHVRILNGDWSRVCTRGSTHTLSVRQGGVCGVFLDPPYGADGVADVYNHDSSTIAGDVAQWALEHGDDPKLRIVLAGFEVEHQALEDAGWAVVDWYQGAGEFALIKGGYGNTGAKGSQMHRDRLWLSPHCIQQASAQQSLFA